LLYKKT